MLPPRAAKTPPQALSRRRFLRELTITTGVLALPAPVMASGAKPKLVIIGGGAAGAACVQALRTQAPGNFDITVITDQKLYNAPYALHGFHPQNKNRCATLPVDLVSAFDRPNVTVVVGRVKAIDPDNKTIRLNRKNAATLAYDILIAAPGIALNWHRIGLNATPDLAAIWTSGASCHNLLNLLTNVPPAGTFALVAPDGPHRCPPAVYERACFAAYWFKRFNKMAKVLIIDQKDQYPMQALFEEAYADYYEDMIEWIPREFHGGITAIDLAKGAIQTDSEVFEADVLNVVPPQQAPEFLANAGLTGKDGYCPIRTPSMQSAVSKDIYIIGDAASAGDISKSAISAGVEARLAAVDIITRFIPSLPGIKINVTDNCWTLLAPDDAISLGGTYTSSGSRFTSKQRFMSMVTDDSATRISNAGTASRWPAQRLHFLYGT